MRIFPVYADPLNLRVNESRGGIYLMMRTEHDGRRIPQVEGLAGALPRLLSNALVAIAMKHCFCLLPAVLHATWILKQMQASSLR